MDKIFRVESDYVFEPEGHYRFTSHFNTHQGNAQASRKSKYGIVTKEINCHSTKRQISAASALERRWRLIKMNDDFDCMCV
jgi:hypothetical protein